MPLEELFSRSDIISLHCPLTEETRHLIDREAIRSMKKGVVLVNTSRGALIDAEALLEGIKERKVGAACLDVYEEEGDIFFEDRSGHILNDDLLSRLISMPNVIVTSHQAFLTEEALNNIAETTVGNISFPALKTKGSARTNCATAAGRSSTAGKSAGSAASDKVFPYDMKRLPQNPQQSFHVPASHRMTGVPGL